ncbi:hypothetical protein [Streptomyces caniscabiei]|uniref:Uncharacterized protein n=1 Tax=Streptomyces caniscabiei TaxID=2746961 RepID=A0A927QJ22_9ACTN|nr:hypothetical protein [Streptomyces caniscabiei]MBD9723507.1 hypothetical protein [Streptomyces caniscabiei]MDX3721071.1 hypothetical protein [Streptomyces caniscabiei]WEO27078.1 hypothetical protein IHE65_30125 [Streptomyces caniscabiei]
MNKSTKPELSFDLGANHLHGVARFDQVRTDTLVQLVQSWAEPKDRDAIIDALDELAEVVCGVRREGELDAAVAQVEDVAGMDTAQVEVNAFDVRRLLAELTAVERVTSRFLTGVRRIGGRLLPGQQDRRRSA